MSNRKLQEFREYRYGVRSVLQPGDRFRVSGGPIYVNDDGTKSLMAERGMFMFRCYCVQGARSGSRRSGWAVAWSSCGWARRGRILTCPVSSQAIQGQEGHRSEAQTGKEAGCRAVCKTRERACKGRSQGCGLARRSWAGLGLPKPRRNPNPKPKQGLPRGGGQVAKNAGKTGVRGRQVEGEPLPLPLGLPQFDPGFYGLL